MSFGTIEIAPASRAHKAKERKKKNKKQLAAERRARLERQLQQSGETNVVWGAPAIGRLTNLTSPSVYHLFRKGWFGDAVRKFGPEPEEGEPDKRPLVGVVSKLRALLGA
jgi:hypothetical protein